MISEIRIGSLGVIQAAHLPLHAGLNVVTGETGAGKTMVVTGLGLLFGARGDAALVRAPAPSLVVEGLIDLPADHPALARAADAGADVEDGLILVRTVAAGGRSRAFAGGRSVPVGTLGELAENLVAVHGQADQWRLRSGEQHRQLLDEFGGDELAAALTHYRDVHTQCRDLAAQVTRLEELVATQTADLDLLRAGVERIEAVDPQPGEDEALRAEAERLAHGEQLRAAGASAAAYLLGDESAPDATGASEHIASAGALIDGVVEHDPALPELAGRLREVGVLVSELGADLFAYADGIDVDDARLAAVHERRAELAGLAKAHGGSLESALTWLAQASARLLDVDTAADDLPELREQLAAAEITRAAAARTVSDLRHAAGTRLAGAVTDELAHLAMGSATLEVAVTGGDGEVRYGPDGVDEVEFLLRSGSGMPPRPIAKSASGGELSRVMLALEVVLGTSATSVPTYVFDEVDAGVGGRAAIDIGARLARLAEHAQVVVVTHLPQVAAFADQHLVVTKTDDGSVSQSDVRVVEARDCEREIARMMAGTDSAAAVRHARELLADARARRTACDD
ncbi:MAG TPA: DNA repair protein RecN [Tetrasphaera sp.]|nr:DNA repair protein RecN [Tetrasphaera sp.]